MTDIVCASAYSVNAQTHSSFWNHAEMRKSASQTLIENIIRLAEYNALDDASWLRAGKPSQSKIAKLAGINQTTVGRILSGELVPTVDVLEKISCKAFGLCAWQLLIPMLEPGNPPVHCMTESEQKFYDRMRTLQRELSEPPPSPYYLSRD